MLAQLRCEQRLEIVPSASHLFEETGALEQVAHLARTSSIWIRSSMSVVKAPIT